jgi:hypothetical protein
VTAWVYDDGGRAGAGFKGHAGDCVARAISIATERPYADVYRTLADASAGYQRRRGSKPHARSARNGVPKPIIRKVMAEWGWLWTPTMSIGSGTTVHLRADELPAGRLVVQVTKHVCAVIDGVVHDLGDPSREGTRAVYGYWSRP